MLKVKDTILSRDENKSDSLFYEYEAQEVL